MNKMIAFCGLDCAQCDAFKFTQANDRPGQEALLARWRVQFDSPDMPLEAVTCDGCTSTGRHGGYCGMCEVRACGVARGVVNCGHCADYSCDKLNAFITRIPGGRKTLDEIHNNR